jgi:multicomponent Na+:H+ antiporter subunit E
MSVLVSLALASRLGIIGREASPYHRLFQLLAYFAWLLIEIAKANFSVLARIVGPRGAIDPVIVNLKTSARSDLGKALFANSITLTPGTVTLDVDGDSVKVHALVRENSPAGSFAAMDRQSAAAADGKG